MSLGVMSCQLSMAHYIFKYFLSSPPAQGAEEFMRCLVLHQFLRYAVSPTALKQLHSMNATEENGGRPSPMAALQMLDYLGGPAHV